MRSDTDVRGIPRISPAINNRGSFTSGRYTLPAYSAAASR